ncbi:MAG: RagB/SusD family nutrient uptake outer membrane protein [Polaribacter sp.]
MKKYIFTIGLFISLSTLISCDDELTNNPYNSLSEDVVFSSPDGFSNAIRGVYLSFIDEKTDNIIGNYYGAGMYSVPDILTDNLIINQSGRKSRETLYNWSYNANSYSAFNLYGDAYKIIRKANAILENIDNLDDGAFKNNIKGEALTARALAHFDLVRTYAQIPTQSPGAGASLGVAYVTTVDPLLKPSRNTVNEVYANIIKDLTTAESIIGTNTIDRFSKNAVNALLSRVYLYMGEWQKVVDAANKVVGSVASRAKFSNVWKDENTDGIISQFLIRTIDRVAIGTEYSQTNSNTGVKSEYVVSFDFYKMFKANDIRKTAYISTSVFSNVNYNHVAKYFGKVGQVNNIVNSKILRMSEVMLNKAEALSQIPGQDGAALVALDAVRKERYSSFVSGAETGQDLKDAIALERRLELAFEGHRFYDLKRKGLAIKRNPTFGDAADGTGRPPTFSTLDAGDHRFQLPIPTDAINSNTNLKQNPEY